MSISIAEARKRGWLKDEPKSTKAKKPDEITHWTRSNIEDWDGPNGWRVGIARMPQEDVMVDMVVAWQGNIPRTRELAVWNAFVKWTIEETETKLKALEYRDAKANIR